MCLLKSGPPLRAPGDQLTLLDSMGSTGCSWPFTWCCHFLCRLREPCSCLRRPLRGVWLNMRQQWMYWPWCPPGILLHLKAKTKKGKVESALSKVEKMPGCVCSSINHQACQRSWSQLWDTQETCLLMQSLASEEPGKRGQGSTNWWPA